MAAHCKVWVFQEKDFWPPVWAAINKAAVKPTTHFPWFTVTSHWPLLSGVPGNYTRVFAPYPLIPRGAKLESRRETVARLIGFAVVITGFWYFFYHNQTWPALSLLLGALWLLVREGRHLLLERRNQPRGRRRGVDRPDPLDPVV